jgi:hypothetical protein
MFRMALGVHPDEYRLPGVEIDLPAYLDASRERARVKAEARETAKSKN